MSGPGSRKSPPPERSTSPGAVGPVEARSILSSAHRGPAAELVALLDAAHARLHAERRALALAEQAVASIAEEPFDDPGPPTP
jgi:hypothetical protein